MHLKRLNTPKRWNVPKKTTKFITRPLPGAHALKFSIPLVVLLRDYLKLVNTSKECKKIVNDKLVLVDNSIVKNIKHSIGLFDVVAIPAHKLYYRIVLDYKGGIKPVIITGKEAGFKPFSILNKTRIKKGRIQLNCTSGRNILLKKNKYNTGDTLVLDLKNKKIIKHLPVKKDSLVLVMHGKHAGETAVIKGFKNFASISKDRVVLKNKEGAEYETMKDYVFVIGEKKSEIRLGKEEFETKTKKTPAKKKVVKKVVKKKSAKKKVVKKVVKKKSKPKKRGVKKR
jgi:small subunit ribosomal protein S4e